MFTILTVEKRLSYNKDYFLADLEKNSILDVNKYSKG